MIGKKQYLRKFSEILQLNVTVNANRNIIIIKKMIGN